MLANVEQIFYAPDVDKLLSFNYNMFNYGMINRSLNRAPVLIAVLICIIFLLFWSLPNPRYVAMGKKQSTVAGSRVDAVQNQTLGVRSLM